MVIQLSRNECPLFEHRVESTRESGAIGRQFKWTATLLAHHQKDQGNIRRKRRGGASTACLKQGTVTGTKLQLPADAFAGKKDLKTRLRQGHTWQFYQAV